MTADLVVAILAGGNSRRMGRPKATITIGGLTLIERLAVVVSGAGLGDPVVVGGDPAWAATLRWFPDLHPGEGPLGGLLSAFQATTDSAVLLLACDLVTPDGRAIADLAERYRLVKSTNPEVDAMIPLGERLEVLHAIYARSVQERLQQSFDCGIRSVERAMQGANVVAVAVGGAPGLSTSVLDADTPEEFAPYGK